jgi:hypothetical protein
MKQPIQMDELLERVSGNMEFVILMMDTFYNSSEERLSTMEREFEARNYDELADRAHQLRSIGPFKKTSRRSPHEERQANKEIARKTQTIN